MNEYVNTTEPPALMTAKTYKTKFAEPMIKKLKKLLKKALAKAFQGLNEYHQLNNANGTIHRENERLRSKNDTLAAENTELKEQNREYSLLRRLWVSVRLAIWCGRQENSKRLNSVRNALEKIIMKGRNTLWKTEFTMKRTVFGTKSREIIISLA